MTTIELEPGETVRWEQGGEPDASASQASCALIGLTLLWTALSCAWEGGVAMALFWPHSPWAPADSNAFWRIAGVGVAGTAGLALGFYLLARRFWRKKGARSPECYRITNRRLIIADRHGRPRCAYALNALGALTLRPYDGEIADITFQVVNAAYEDGVEMVTLRRLAQPAHVLNLLHGSA